MFQFHKVQLKVAMDAWSEANEERFNSIRYN